MTNAMLFEGPVLEDVLDDARTYLGDDLEIDAANRVRRGGVLGFFATEWYEVWARPGRGATEHPALALLDRADADAFEAMVRTASEAALAPADPVPEYEAALDRFFDERDGGASRRAPVPAGAVAAPTPTRPAPTAPAPAPAPVPAATAAPGPVPAAVALEDEPRGRSVFDAPRERSPELLWAMLDRLESVPRAPGVPDSGVVVFVGDAPAAIEAARAVGARSGRWNGDLAVLTRAPELEGVPSWLLIGDLDELATRVDRWRQRDAVVPVVVDHGVEAVDRAWAARALTAVGAEQVRLVAEAWRLPEDVGRMAAKLGGVDCLEVVEVCGAVEPLALVDLGIPISTVQGRPCTPELLAAVWLENRRRG